MMHRYVKAHTRKWWRRFRSGAYDLELFMRREFRDAIRMNFEEEVRLGSDYPYFDVDFRRTQDPGFVKNGHPPILVSFGGGDCFAAVANEHGIGGRRYEELRDKILILARVSEGQGGAV